MRSRAPWLLLGGAAWLSACGLSTQGASLGDLGAMRDSGDTVDAADTSDGSMPAPPDSGGMPHPMADGSTHKPDAGPDATHPGGPDGGPSDGGPAGADAQDGPVASEGGGDAPSDDGTIPDDAGTAGEPCDGSAGCEVNVPPGWSLVAFAADQTAACPAGFTTPANVVESPNASAACTCGSCSVTGQPSCASGTVGVYYDYVTSGTHSCSTPGMVPQLNNDPAGACGSGSDVYHGNYAPFDIAYTPPPSTGGSCSAPGSATGAVTYGAHDRTCVPSS